jgi:predicted nucleic acid-binding protein
VSQVAHATVREHKGDYGIDGSFHRISVRGQAIGIAVDAAALAVWSAISFAAVSNRGGQPRSRSMDLVIAATANIHGVPLLTHNAGDFQIIGDLVDVRHP